MDIRQLTARGSRFKGGADELVKCREAMTYPANGNRPRGPEIDTDRQDALPFPQRITRCPAWGVGGDLSDVE
jgi:hypothetical protein